MRYKLDEYNKPVLQTCGECIWFAGENCHVNQPDFEGDRPRTFGTALACSCFRERPVSKRPIHLLKTKHDKEFCFNCQQQDDWDEDCDGCSLYQVMP